MPDDVPSRTDAAPPLTVSRPELLEDGADRPFRQMVYDMLTVASRMADMRDRLAEAMGVTGPQYSVIMAVAHLEGEGAASVRRVAERLHVTGAFVTAEAGKLADLGFLEKRRNPEDRRGVLLSLSESGREKLEAVAPMIRAINDRFFASLGASEFRELRRIVAAMVADSEDAILAAGLSRPGRTDRL